MYEELKDDKGRVWILFLPEEDYYCAAYNRNGWYEYKTCIYYMPGRNPGKIARNMREKIRDMQDKICEISEQLPQKETNSNVD